MESKKNELLKEYFSRPLFLFIEMKNFSGVEYPTEEVSQNDLVIEELKNGKSKVLKNGVNIVKQLS
jgi:hypothetical protein